MMNLTTPLMSFWGYALESIACILNMVPTKNVDKTPYELWHGKVPNLSYLKNGLISQEASGSNVNLEVIQDTDTQPSENTSEHHNEVEHENVEPQSDKVPIRTFNRIPQAPNRYGFYVDAEEHELGDHIEPANYKAALTVGANGSSRRRPIWMPIYVHIFKARLMAKGYTQTYGVYYEETFFLVTDIRAIRILIAKTVFYGYDIWQMDVKTAFLNCRLNEDVYMVQPEGCVEHKYPRRMEAGNKMSIKSGLAAKGKNIDGNLVDKMLILPLYVRAANQSVTAASFVIAYIISATKENSWEAYDKVFNHLDMLHAPIEEEVLILTIAKSLLLLLV
ncbi:retrotransposon protein, putative, ty1-copia subclass [Tanacetum coccineum]